MPGRSGYDLQKQKEASVASAVTVIRGAELSYLVPSLLFRQGDHNFLEAISKLLPLQIFNVCKHLGRVVTVKASMQQDCLGLVAARSKQTQGNYSTTGLSPFKIRPFSRKNKQTKKNKTK